MFETAGVLPAVFCVREAGVPAVGAAAFNPAVETTRRKPNIVTGDRRCAAGGLLRSGGGRACGWSRSVLTRRRRLSAVNR